MRLQLAVTLVALLALAANLVAQNPPAPQRPPASPPPVAQPGARGAGGRAAVQTMTLTSSAWPDGGAIPLKHSQAGEEISPPLSWGNVPEGTVSFVLLVHDVDAAIGNGTDDILHWLVWNIPGSARELPEDLPQGSQLPDGTRQLSASGPYYRGPGALAAGPIHHYVFELFALDTAIDVPAVATSPLQTRAAVIAGIAGHVRGKGVYVGLFKRK